jgi:ABC-type transport system involved in multi-copper enzyme maturation permease subunit
LFVTGEYSTGMIRSTLAAIPKRVPVLWAKLIVMATVTLAAMVPTCVVAFVAAQGIISQSRAGYSLGDPGVLRVVFGTAVYLTIIGLIGAMLGWIVRSTPGALVAFVALFLVVPVLFGSVLGSFGKHVAEYLPSNAGASFASSIREAPSLAPWTGLGVLGVWLVAAIAAAIWTLTHRDA